MMNWDDARFFLAVARCGTLRKAASQLHVDQATVGRRLSAEDALGSKLFIRTPKSFALSPLGGNAGGRDEDGKCGAGDQP